MQMQAAARQAKTLRHAGARSAALLVDWALGLVPQVFVHWALGLVPQVFARPWRAPFGLASQRVFASWLPLLLLGISACGPRYPAAQLEPELAGLPIPTQGPVLVLAPGDVPRQWTGEASFKRLSLLSEALSARGWVVFSPWEYRMYRRAFGTEVVAASNLIKTLDSWSVSAHRVWILQFELSEALSSQSTNLDTGRSVATARQHEREIEARLRIIDPRLDKCLGGVYVRLQQDPFSEQADAIDHLPALSEALIELVDALSAQMVERGVQLGESSRHGLVLRSNPKRLASYAQTGQSSLDADFGGFAEFERLALLLRHYQFFFPTLEVEEVKRWESLPLGVELVEVGELAEQGLQAGDFISHVDGLVIDGVAAFDRVLRAPKQQRSLRLLRGGEELELVLELGRAT
ncbi:MAG: hypothetical protein RBU37_16265 [Myxococcota bacterium]|jgi:hypothetical protein|nr:hypothetical protein [Myxococcota bacterium]